MAGVTRYCVGDKVRISEACFRRMQTSNRSIRAYPSCEYLSLAKAYMQSGDVGEVTRVFPPGYEVTVKFGGGYLHVKDHWVERCEP